MNKINFDELLAKRNQRKLDEVKVCQIPIPNTDDKYLVATMPSDAKIMKWLGQVRNGDTESLFDAIDDAIYTCCSALQDQKLREAIGAQVPTDIVPLLFSVAERNQMGYDVLKFVGIFRDNEDDEDNKESEDIVKN